MPKTCVICRKVLPENLLCSQPIHNDRLCESCWREGNRNDSLASQLILAGPEKSERRSSVIWRWRERCDPANMSYGHVVRPPYECDCDGCNGTAMPPEDDDEPEE